MIPQTCSILAGLRGIKGEDGPSGGGTEAFDCASTLQPDKAEPKKGAGANEDRAGKPTKDVLRANWCAAGKPTRAVLGSIGELFASICANGRA